MNPPVFGIPSFGIPVFGIPVFGIPDFGIPGFGISVSRLALALLVGRLTFTPRGGVIASAKPVHGECPMGTSPQ